MGTSFGEFRQTPKGKGFSPTWFNFYFSVLLMVWLIRGREWPFDQSQILGPKCGNFWSPFWIVHGLFGQFV